MKNEKEKKKPTIKICPRCKSPRIRPAVNVSGWLAPNMIECWQCGYIGPIYIEMDLEDYEALIKEENERKKKS